MEKTNEEICENLCEIRDRIISLEHILFCATGPVSIEKLDCNSHHYNCAYDLQVRRRYSLLVNLLGRFMEGLNETSMAAQILENIETSLASAEFYRQIIFDGKCPLHDEYKNKFRFFLIHEIEFLKLRLNQEDYRNEVESICENEFPETKEEFFAELEKGF